MSILTDLPSLLECWKFDTPISKLLIPPLETEKSNTFKHRKQKIRWGQGSKFRSKYNIYPPPPLWKLYFFPSPDTSFFDSRRGLFALILPYFAIILPFYFPFPHFLSPFFIFFYIFLFLFAFSYFSPQMTLGDIPPGGGGGIFQYIDLWVDSAKLILVGQQRWKLWLVSKKRRTDWRGESGNRKEASANKKIDMCTVP